MAEPYSTGDVEAIRADDVKWVERDIFLATLDARDAEIERWRALHENAEWRGATYLATLRGLSRLIRKILDDEESRPGGWGPDVTCVSYLEEALTKIESARAGEEIPLHH